jgi:hypothetical protein
VIIDRKCRLWLGLILLHADAGGFVVQDLLLQGMVGYRSACLSSYCNTLDILDLGEVTL